MSKQPPLSEKQLVELLKLRFQGDSGNGPTGCIVPQVRDAAGFNASRTIDALGFHFWPSRGLLIDGFECKSSRADWKKELETPEKAEVFCNVVDRFWIVAGRKDLVLEDELPPKWGLLVPRGDVLTQIRPAALLHATDHTRRVPLPPNFNRSFLIAVIRQAYKVSRVEPEEIRVARASGYKEGQAARAHRSAAYDELYHTLQEKVREFETALGYPIGGVNWPRDLTPKEVGAALRAVLSGDSEAEALRKRLDGIAQNARRIAEEADKHVEALDAATKIQPSWRPA